MGVSPFLKAALKHHMKSRVIRPAKKPPSGPSLESALGVQSDPEDAMEAGMPSEEPDTSMPMGKPKSFQVKNLAAFKAMSARKKKGY